MKTRIITIVLTNPKIVVMEIMNKIIQFLIGFHNNQINNSYLEILLLINLTSHFKNRIVLIHLITIRINFHKKRMIFQS